MADAGSVYVPIVFMDGESKLSGVRIYPSAKYKDFKSCLSNRLGISPNQITIHIFARKKPKNSLMIRRKCSGTGKVSFSTVVWERDCFFLVVFKRMRGKPKPRQGGSEFSGLDSPDYIEVPRLVFLDNDDDESSTDHNGVPRLEFVDDDENLQNLQIQREKYATAIKLKSNLDMISNVSLGSNSFPRMEESKGDSTLTASDRPFCQECAGGNGDGTSEPFHLCKYDAVIEGFRSKAGPIARPREGSTSSFFPRSSL
ncbi:hypothetical protein U1Q18_043085 [Sarracenia purpurea var. burkii]